MTHTISKTFRFEAAHRLPGLRDGHPCGNVHGHSYKLTVYVRGTLAGGMVMDYADIDYCVRWELLRVLDHVNLNDVIENPTAENIAEFCFTRLEKVLLGLHAVEVAETDKTSARVER